MALSFTKETIANSQQMTGWFPTNIGVLQFSPAGAAYYVTTSTVGNASTGNVVVQKRTAAGVWSAAIVGVQSTNVAVAISGHIIYILSETIPLGNKPLHLMRFDTSTDAYISDGANGPVNQAGSDYFSLTTFSDGKLLACYTDAADNLNAAVYDPVGNSWTAGVQLLAHVSGQIQLYGVAAQSSTPRAFVFYAPAPAPFSIAVKCVSITSASVLGAEQAVVTLTVPGGTQLLSANLAVGKPAVVNDPANPYIILPYLDPGTSGPPSPGYVNLRVARAVPATNPVFATEAVFNTSAPNLFQTFDLLNDNIVYDSAALDQSGTVFIVFVTDNGDLDSAASQAKVFYVDSSAPGVWNAPTLINTTPLSKEYTSPFIAHDSNGNIAFVINSWDPVIYTGGGDQYPALASFFFFQASAPAPAGPAAASILNAQSCASIVFPFVLSCCRQCEMDPPYQRGKVVYASSEFEY